MGKLVNRARMTVSGTPGTGAVTLGSAVAGHQAFVTAGVINGDIVSYVIEDGTSWEVGQGTYSSSGPTLTRTTIQGSSNGGGAVSFTSSAVVYIAALATDLTQGTSANQLLALDGSAKIPAVDGSQLTGLVPGQLTETINTQVGTTYVLTLADQGKLIQMTSSSANVITVPTNAAVAWPIGRAVDIVRWGTGGTTISGSGGVTLSYAGSAATLRAQYSVVTLFKVATDGWLIVGDLTP